MSEQLVFRSATIVALLHALDDAFVNRQPGVGADQHLVAGLVALAIAALAILAFARVRPGLRSLLALLFGVMALANGVQHVIHIATDTPARSDVTGAAAALAGLALVALAIWVPFRHRGEGMGSRGRRWTNRILAVGAGIVMAYVVVLPLAVAIVSTHKYRESIGAPPSPAYRPVTFAASDGLKLSGWYVPSRNRAAVLLVHGGGGDRTGPQAHAALLARHGYGVLLYDSRGRGTSEGSPNQFGWGWEKDVAGALTFLRHRRDVDRRRIGGLGLSTGADVLIRIAARPHDELEAVVGDGATGESFADARNLRISAVDVPYWAVLYAAAQVLSGSAPGPPLKELVPRVAPTPLLLIAAGSFASEGRFNRLYASVAREPFELWELPGVGHTAAIRERGAEYERRVIGFLDRALLVGRGGRPAAGAAS
ncbi:MAG: alpha/beta hydrolase [Actinomycetota bacterium]|nr:alpha/beta hydrolase [Actinomycetota bacterium]